MKSILWKQTTYRLPDLTGYSGNGSIAISEELYFEYMYKLQKFLELAEKVTRLAESQNLDTGRR